MCFFGVSLTLINICNYGFLFYFDLGNKKLGPFCLQIHMKHCGCKQRSKTHLIVFLAYKTHLIVFLAYKTHLIVFLAYKTPYCISSLQNSPYCISSLQHSTYFIFSLAQLLKELKITVF